MLEIQADLKNYTRSIETAAEKVMKVGCGEVSAGIAVTFLIQGTVPIAEMSIPDYFSAVAGEKTAVSGDTSREGAIEDVDTPRNARSPAVASGRLE